MRISSESAIKVVVRGPVCLEEFDPQDGRFAPAYIKTRCDDHATFIRELLKSREAHR
jgi:hypothetical protein